MRILFTFITLSYFSFAKGECNNVLISASDTIVLNAEPELAQESLLIDTVVQHRDERMISSFLAFPFPLGILGAHRIYMGAKPYIPLIYIATLGGCFGILPLIDFVVLITHKDTRPYRNDKVFMWLK